MKILITGGNGFVAKELSFYFNRIGHQVISTDRNNFDPTNIQSINNFLKDKKFDILIHTAVVGGKRLHKENVEDLHKNILMFNNLCMFSDKFEVMFNFGSGAEFDRKMDISLAKETDIFNKLPSDYYGLSKNLITRKIVGQNSNFYNLRLFGCFGGFEEPQRLFKNNYGKVLSKKKIVIHQDKMMDYFYAEDIGRVIEFIYSNREIERDLNLCYSNKKSLSEMLTIFARMLNCKEPFEILNKQKAFSYTGSSEKLEKLNIELIGLEKGLKQCLINWNRF